MMPQFPSTPAKYEAFFRYLAEIHVNIAHQDNSCHRFAVVNEIPTNPFTGPDFTDFFQKQRSKFEYGSSDSQKQLVMVLVEMASDPDVSSDRPTELIDGGFLLLAPMKSNDLVTKGEIKDLAKATGLDILKWMSRFIELNGAYGFMEDCSADPVGIIAPDNLTGYRFDFKYRLFSTGLCNYDNFAGVEPEAL